VLRREVTESGTALTVGSGEVPVLSTPRRIAWREAVRVRAAAPLAGAAETTVGTAVRARHVRATRVGGRVEASVEAPPACAAGRRPSFRARAADGSGRPVAEGQIDRAIVDRQGFLVAPDPAPDR
jgi:predicted thioesterase